MVFDTHLLASAVLITTPLLFAAVGELIAERAGIINIGLEGMMLVGALFAFWAAVESGSLWLGLGAGLLAGLLLAVIMALLSIEARADQLIAGLGILILAYGLSTFIFHAAFSSVQRLVTPMRSAKIPGLDQIPVVGPALFSQRALVYVAFLLVPAVALLLYRSTWGLAIRAAGDLPDAAETNGLSVRRIRWIATLTAGALAGAGGAFLSIGQVGTFLDRMTAGRGFLALAAVIFGGWRPGGVLAACFLFGGADALQLRLQGQSVPRDVWIALAVLLLVYALWSVVRGRLGRRGGGASYGEAGVALVLVAGSVVLSTLLPDVELPSQLWLAMPFVLAVVALAGLHRRAAMPRYLAVPYVREAEN